MSRYSIPLVAGKPRRLPYPGKMLQVVDLGGASEVVVEVEWGGDQQSVETMGGVGEKFKLYADRVFTAITLTCATSVTVDLMVSYYDVTFNPSEGVNVTATIDATQLPLPVAINGTPAVTVSGVPHVIVDTLPNVVVATLPQVTLAAGNFPLAMQAVDPVPVLAFAAGGDREDLAADATSAATVMDGAGENLRVTNETDETALVKPGGGGDSADDADALPVLAHSERVIAWPSGATHAHCKLRAGTGTVGLQLGNGV